MTLREYINFWQETYDKSQSRPTTYAAHNYVFKNHIIPGLGDIPLSELTSEMVEDFLEERRRFGNHRPGNSGLGEETMRHIHRLLQQCLDQAMRDGLIGDNPARAFHYSKPKKVNADVLTPLEMEDYLDAAERLGHLPMFMLALTAGLRQGELIALKWNDLNVKNRTLTISEQRSVERRELIEYGSETRTITLTSEVIDLLIMEHTKHPKSPLMFMHPATQRPYSPQMVRRMHNEIIKEAGLDHMLGKLYLAGKEVPRDEEKAAYWLTQSAEQGNQYAQYLLNHLEENRPPSAMLAVTRLLHHMSRVFRDNSVPKFRPGGIQIDRKRLKKLQEKRIALGHKPDDHEEQWPDLIM